MFKYIIFYVYLLINSITPNAVHGMNVSIFMESFPILIIWNPSTSFLGSTALQTFLSDIWAGTGSWTKIPSTEEFKFSSSIFEINSLSVMVLGNFMVVLSIPRKKAGMETGILLS